MDTFKSPWKSAELIESLTAMTNAKALNWTRKEFPVPADNGSDFFMNLVYQATFGTCHISVVKDSQSREISCQLEKQDAPPVRVEPVNSAPLAELFRAIGARFPLEEIYEADIDRMIEQGKRYKTS